MPEEVDEMMDDQDRDMFDPEKDLSEFDEDWWRGILIFNIQFLFSSSFFLFAIFPQNNFLTFKLNKEILN